MASPSRRLAAVCALVVALVALALPVGCGGGRGAPNDEPILQPPPGATEIGRFSRGSKGGGLLGIETSAVTEVVWASPQTLEELRSWYVSRYGNSYNLSPSTDGPDRVVLPGTDGTAKLQVTVELRTELRTDAPFTDSVEQLGKVPRGTVAFARVSVSRM